MTAMQLAMPAQAKLLPRLSALHKLAQMHMCRYTYALPSRLLLQVGLEVAERLGCLFTDYKGRRPAVAGFFFIVVMYKVCVHFQRRDARCIHAPTRCALVLSYVKVS